MMTRHCIGACESQWHNLPCDCLGRSANIDQQFTPKPKFLPGRVGKARRNRSKLFLVVEHLIHLQLHRMMTKRASMQSDIQRELDLWCRQLVADASHLGAGTK